MTLDEIHREAGQVREIDALRVVRLGFIAVNSFAEKEAGYSYYVGEDLYHENHWTQESHKNIREQV